MERAGARERDGGGVGGSKEKFALFSGYSPALTGKGQIKMTNKT